MLLFLCFSMYSLNGFAAFNENESEQLSAINNKSQKKVDEIVSSLNDTQRE